ncbi:hypothetical protein BGX34_010895 [Mortierella sp. NVP85]|nr:hypothetical protein BGX34_010895 [Mortierella sp. NVP85]
MPPQPAPGDCRFCGRHFKFLREHEKNMHDGDAGRMERVPCTFPYCTSRFLNKAALRKHFEKHHRFARSPSPPPAPLITLPLLPQHNTQGTQVAKEETQSQQELQNPPMAQQQDQQQDQQPERQDRDEPKQPQRQDDPSTEQQPHRSITLQHTEPEQPPTDPKLQQSSQEELSKQSESTQGQGEAQQEPPPPPSMDSSGNASSLKPRNSEQAIPNGQGGARASSPKVL